MVRPPVAPGVKQDLYPARRRVDSTQVWAFVQITAMAGEREILDIIAASVLTGDYVLDLMRHRAMMLAKLAVLAAISSPAPDKLPGSGIHCSRRPSSPVAAFMSFTLSEERERVCRFADAGRNPGGRERIPRPTKTNREYTIYYICGQSDNLSPG